MSLELLLYLAEVLGNINIIITVVFFVSLISIVMALFICAAESYNPFTEFKHIKKVIIGYSIFILLCVFVPNQKYVYLIIASRAGKEVVKSEVFEKAMKVLNKKLDQELEKN